MDFNIYVLVRGRGSKYVFLDSDPKSYLGIDDQLIVAVAYNGLITHQIRNLGIEVSSKAHHDCCEYESSHGFLLIFDDFKNGDFVTLPEYLYQVSGRCQSPDVENGVCVCYWFIEQTPAIEVVHANAQIARRQKLCMHVKSERSGVGIHRDFKLSLAPVL
jgi:hypothetical protein